jgi:hypothetical protein
MRTCRICRFETEMDDVVLALPSGACVCLRCYDRETNSARPMPKALRRAVIDALAAFEVSGSTATADHP